MNVLQRICEKYRAEYNLMPDPKMRNIQLTFGPSVPEGYQERIRDSLTWMGVFEEDDGVPVCLDVSPDNSERYVLKVSGAPMFHFSTTAPGMAFVEYDMCEAVLWAIYIVAGRKNWLDGYQERYLISCRCFTARQQAAALQISDSVNRQYESALSQEQLERIFNELRQMILETIRQVPRFSAQPIEKKVFDTYKGKVLEGTCREIAQTLYGQASFDQETDAFARMVLQSEPYNQLVEEAAARLVELAHSLPLLAVGHLFTELETMVDGIEPVPVSELDRLLRQRVSFVLSPEKLKEAFNDLDRAYARAARSCLETRFLRTACDRANARIKPEFNAAKRGIMQLRGALSRFCFVRPGCFDQDGGALSWERLSHLEERDVSSRDVSWTPETLSNLQGVIRSQYAPQVWICSERLRNMAELAANQDIHLIQAAPILDERQVWAIWVDNL